RLRHAGGPLAALAALAGALVYRWIDGSPEAAVSAEAVAIGVAAASFATLLAAPARAVLVAASIIVWLALSVVIGLAEAALWDEPPGMSGDFGASLLAAALLVCLCAVRPFRRMLTRDEIVINAAPDRVFETLQPQRDGAYWKEHVRVRPVPARPELFDFAMAGRGGDAAHVVRLRMITDAAQRIITFESVDDGVLDAGVVGGLIDQTLEHYAVVPTERGALVVLVYDMRRPSLGFLAAHALLDLTGDELRLLKQYFEGGAGPAFIGGV
ncbi:MAG: hypothetical protein AAGM38_14740, partial [Pseudomonadota bacterium]